MTHPLAANAFSDCLPVGARAELHPRGVPNLPADTLNTVWQSSGTELARLAASLGMRAAEAEDVLQDVYVAALAEQGNRPAAAAELRLWLFRVTINRCHLEHRRRGRWRNLVSNFWRWGKTNDSNADAASVCQLDHERALVRQTLETLEADLKTPLVLRYFCDLDSREIGRILDLPDSTVRSRLRAARKRLAAELIQAGYEYE